jgi:hypothetical protein
VEAVEGPRPTPTVAVDARKAVMATLYEVLGAAETADHAELRRAFRSRARELHPDLHPGVDTTERMRALNAAWRILGDAETRRTYDRELAGERRRDQLRSRPAPTRTPSPPPPARGRPGDRDLDLGDDDERFDHPFDADLDDGDYVDSGVLAVPRWVHRGVVGVIALVIIGLVVVSAHAGPSTGTTRPTNPPLLDASATAVGRCVVLSPVAGLVECTAATPQRVVAELTAGSTEFCPPGVLQVRLPGRPTTLCVTGL